MGASSVLPEGVVTLAVFTLILLMGPTLKDWLIVKLKLTNEANRRYELRKWNTRG